MFEQKSKQEDQAKNKKKKPQKLDQFIREQNQDQEYGQEYGYEDDEYYGEANDYGQEGFGGIDFSQMDPNQMMNMDPTQLVGMLG